MSELKEKSTVEGNENYSSSVDGQTQAVPPSQYGKVDIAEQFLASLDASVRDTPIDPAEERRVLWKIDLIVLPLLAGSIILSAIDKNVISNAAIYGLRTDTNLVGDQYAWAGSIFYFGYLFAEGPTAYAIQKFPVAKLFASIVYVWGVLACCTAATSNFAGLATVRFLMGAMEAIVYPTASIMCVMWWSKSEQPVRTAFWFNTLSTMIQGIVSYGVGQTHSALAQWRVLYLILGGFTFLWATLLLFFLPDSPANCRWLNDREKFICFERVRNNNTGVEDKSIKWYQVRECLLDHKTWLLVIFATAQNIINGGLVVFSSIIVTGFGFTTLQAVLIGIPTGVIGTVFQLLLSYPAAKIKNSRCFIVAAADLVPLASAILLWKLPRDNKNGLLAAYFSFWTFFAPYALTTSLPMANTSGHSKKVTMNAMWYASYAVGNIIGPQCFRATDAPAYNNGYVGLLSCNVVAISAILAYRYSCVWENSKRDKSALGAETSLDDETFSDKTDKEKKTFRYVY